MLTHAGSYPWVLRTYNLNQMLKLFLKKKIFFKKIKHKEKNLWSAALIDILSAVAHLREIP